MKENRYKAYKDRKVREYRALRESGGVRVTNQKDGSMGDDQETGESPVKFVHKKSLGQNFLKTESILDLIVESGEIEGGDVVLEIGPGEGALTKKILEKITNINLKQDKEESRLICIEKDYRLIPILSEKFSHEIEEGSLELLEEDILKWSIDEYTSKTDTAGSKPSETKNTPSETFKYKLIANIPYYITGAIIEQFLSAHNKPECIIVMVQKEVADRVVSKDKKQSILALCTKYYGDSEIVKIVKPGNFNPPPKIDSAVLKITLNKIKIAERKLLHPDFENTYLQIVKKGMAHKRKKLSSNLKDFDSSYVWTTLFEKMSLNENVRGEDLGFDVWLNITKNYLGL